MPKRITYIAAAFLSLLLLQTGCSRDTLETDMPAPGPDVPEGTPVTLAIPFSSIEQYEVDVTTKAESSDVDESRIQNLYVMLFDNTDTPTKSQKIYGRYFSHDHLEDDATTFNSNDNECWFVNNKKLGSGEGVLTEGAVKISTVTCSNVILVVIANITNAVTNLDGMNSLDRLKAVQNYNELKDIQICLEQDIVNRKDLFLMTGELANKNTRDMMWNTAPGNTTLNPTYRVPLIHVDAKVKFRVKVNPTYISAAKPVYWQVCNTPDRCYLYTKDGRGNAPEEIEHFDSQQYYFEGTENVKDPSTNEILETYYTFCFYMLENNQSPNGTAEKYYQREVRDKIDSGEPGYEGKTGSQSGAFGTHFVENGEWKYAPTYGTYVRFDLILTLTEAGIAQMGEVDTGQLDITQALTSDAIFTVHLGNFVNSGDRTEKDGTAISGSQFNDYETKRGHSYTYTITINNTTNIYAEVTNDEEVQAGQEGFLLLTDTEIINADCHYEYHQITFDYRPHLDQNKFSWYVKTPFGEGGPVITKNLVTGEYTYDGNGLDYLWVKFGVNNKVAADAPSDGTDTEAWYDHSSGATVCPYSKKRHAYPGDSHYHPEWKPGLTVNDGDGKGDKDVPDLMDITQLIEYIFAETKKEDDTPGSSDFISDSGSAEIPVIRVTAFIDEYYYEKDPTKPNAPVDPDLWRKFVNANPRELHILSDAKSSRDRKSDVIMSSHSVIQQSIQTIYNIYSADLQSLWGTEHIDEMRVITDGWPYWPSGKNEGRAGSFNTITGKENGRLNSAYIWQLYNKQDETGSDNNNVRWDSFLNYDVHNNTPELKDAYHGMAYSCLARNRDNNGNGKIDRDEVRWYLAACNQLIGMWVGNESLSMSARLYRPAERQWRAHILSSTDRRVCWAEEGGGATNYSLEVSDETWASFNEAAKGESVRCLRNIGTYYDETEGAVMDITKAPYKVRTQNYFTITPQPNDNLTVQDDPSTHYVFSFDRLNPKSLRELTEGELPFNDQYSINNCVYLKMETQSRNDELLLMDSEGDYYPDYAYPYSKSIDKLNEEIDKLGFNPYCPPGYRFQNQVENLLMSVYLPESFFIKDPSNVTYPGTVYIPTRTYFDRGPYGQNTEGFEYDRQGFNGAKNREQQKVGWTYNTNSKKNTAARKTYNMSHSRCVRDVNMTGTIEGGLLMNDVLYPGDQVPVSFSFYSSGSAFISGSLKFCYTDGSGVYHERDIPVQTTPSGLQYLATQNIKLPTVTEMGLGDLPLSAAKPKFKITLRNAYVSKTFEQPVSLHNPLDGTITIIGEELYPSDNSLISFNISSQSNSCKLQSRKLSLAYTDKDGASRTVELLATNSPTAPVSTDSLTYKRTNQPIPLPGLSSLNLSLANVDAKHDATLILEVEDAGGSKAVVSKIIKLANPLTADAITLSDATDDSVYPGDQNHISLSAQSKANSINISSVTLEIIPQGGASQSISLPGGVPSLKTYSLTDGAITIPNRTTLGVSASDLDAGKTATLRVTYTAGDYTKSFDKPITLSNPLTAEAITLSDATDNSVYPGDQNHVSLSAQSKANSINISSVTMAIIPDGGSAKPISLPGDTPSSTNYSLTNGAITIPDLATLGVLASDLDAGKSATLQVTYTAGDYTKSIEKSVTIGNPVSGSMSTDESIYPNDNANVTIDFASAANSFDLTSATLKLYNGGSLIHTFDLTGNLPSGKTYKKTPLALSIPVLSSLDSPLDGSNFEPMDLTLKLTVSTDNDFSYTVEQPVTLRSHIKETHLDIVKSLVTSGFPVEVQAELYDGNGVLPSVTSAVLWWKEQGGTWQQHVLSNTTNVQQVITTSLSGISAFDASSHSYINYKFVVACSDGTTATTPVWSMQFLRKGYSPNGAKWSDLVEYLDFSTGTYIQTSLAVGATVHKGELLGIGIGRIPSDCFYSSNAEPRKTLHAFYRDKSQETPPCNLYIAGWNPTISNYLTFKYTFNDSQNLVLLLDKNGMFWNDTQVNWGNSKLSENFNNITGSEYLLIGSEQGVNRSKATYDFIRVIRQYEIATP